MRLLSGLQDLLFPITCLGCGALGESLCSNCASSYKLGNFLTRADCTPTYSAVEYNPVVRRILLASKEDGVRSADDLLVNALECSLRHAVERTERTPVLVPIPSSPRAVRKRGRDYVDAIAKRVSDVVGLPTLSLLQHVGGVKDQTLLGASDRFKNLEGAFSLRKQPVRTHKVFLIDDLITTGATLNEAVKTLERSGIRVVGAVTALVSLPLR